MKKLIPALLSLVLAVVMSCATVEGDKKIRDTTEDIREKEKQARKEQEERREHEEAQEEKEWWLQDPAADDRDYDDDVDADLEFEASGEFLSLLLEYAISIRYSDYPYAPSVPYTFWTTVFAYPDETKFYALQLASSASYHFDGTWGNLNRLTIQLTGFQVNLLQQSFFGATERFRLFSVNAGCSLPIPDAALLSAYAGAYFLDFLDTPLPSFGASLQLFLPPRLYLDLYNLNAVLEGLWFGHLSGSLSFALWRFGLAVGYTYNNFAGHVFQGPSLGVSLWL